MKVNPRHIFSNWKKVVLHPFLILLVILVGSCDFDIPEKFEMPTWYLDLKIPLVQTKYEMTDLSNPDAGIFPTDDSLGFKIVQKGEMPATELPDLPKIPIGLDQSISSGEIPGINLDIELPAIVVAQKIDVVLYDLSIYQDTAKWCDTITIDIGFGYTQDTLICVTDSTTGDTLGRLFSFPNDSVRHMKAQDYNSLIVALFDSVMSVISSTIDTTIDLGLSTIDLPENPAIIASIDKLIITDDPVNSIYKTVFKNNGLPTDLQNISSYLFTGNSIPLNDSLAYHSTFDSETNSDTTISRGQTFQKETLLGQKGLQGFLKMFTNMSLEQAPNHPDSVVQILPGSLYVDFELAFQMAGLSEIEVTTNAVSLTDDIENEPIVLPEMDMTETGISKMEIYRNILQENVTNNFNLQENRLQIINLQSTLPFDMNFLLDFQNFFPQNQQDPLVKIDTVLKNTNDPINTTFNMEGYFLQSTVENNDGPDGIPCPSYNDWVNGNCDDDEYPDSSFSTFDLVLDVNIPEQSARIPLDGSPLGEFKMDMKLDQLVFSKISANLYMELPSDPQEQEFPAGFTGAIPTEAQFDIIFKNQIELPIEMNMDFKGYNSLGELTYLPINFNIGYPCIDDPTTCLDQTPNDTALTVISLNKLGTTVTIYEDVRDSIPFSQNTETPCDTCASIIDLLASNPTTLIIDPQAKVDGRGNIEANKALGGGFEVTIPFVLQLSPMTFMGGKATKIEEFEHETRYKIRNSLLETSLVSNITNAMPFGAEVAVLMSNDSVFPTDTSREQLNYFRDSVLVENNPYLYESTDSLYIIRKCSDLSPDSSSIYIYNIMTDYSDCVDGLPYIVKSEGSSTDTVISYVDTLFKFFLPDPEAYYGENDTTGFPQGMVALPGSGEYYSTIDSNKIFLLTDYGDHYTMPRFYLPGTGDVGVFISVNDYLEISSFITFTLSSSGAFGSAENELIITYPNGGPGEILYTDQSYDILWASYGKSSETVSLFYSTSDGEIDSLSGVPMKYKQKNCVVNEGWSVIVENVDNTGSYSWNLDVSGIVETDSLRLKVQFSDGSACDINGSYIKVLDSSTRGIYNNAINPRLTSFKR
tara:strand:- start:82 stop:3366 length:3285 start_codon:yes stop_codon:yes gene_type:complete